jgi:FemAB-related protein (PEP-CTERM system-associated)
MECTVFKGENQIWDDFVTGQPAGTFFHLSGWRNILSSSFGYQPLYLWALDYGAVRGVLPLFLVKSLFSGRSLVTIPFGVYGGILAADQQAGHILLSEAMRLARELDVRFLELRGNPYGEFDMTTHVNGAHLYWSRKDLYFTFLSEVGPSDDVNLARIPRKQRRMIRHGQKNGLKAVFDDGRLTDFYDVYAANVSNLGTPVFGYSYFQTLLSSFEDKCKVLLIEYQGKIIAGVMSFFYRDQVLPYYGGALKDAVHLAPNDFMYWELMRYAAAQGCKQFDFGRSKAGTGAYNFKRHWGFEPKPLPYWCYSPGGQAIPDTSPLNPNLQWAIRLWRRLPLPITKSLGPHIVRHFP